MLQSKDKDRVSEWTEKKKKETKTKTKQGLSRCCLQSVIWTYVTCRFKRRERKNVYHDNNVKESQ